MSICGTPATPAIVKRAWDAGVGGALGVGGVVLSPQLAGQQDCSRCVEGVCRKRQVKTNAHRGGSHADAADGRHHLLINLSPRQSQCVLVCVGFRLTMRPRNRENSVGLC